MTEERLEEILQEDEPYGAFDRMAGKRSKRPDLHAMMLLDSLVPEGLDMVASAEHDQIWLDVEVGALAKVATEEQVRELRRCGVFVSDGYLSMFV